MMLLFMTNIQSEFDMTSIAMIDLLGLTYDGDTLKKRGLGGSESAVIYTAKELSDLGFDVTVFNNCIDSQSSEGTFDGVKYVDVSRLREPNNYECDIMIASRSVVPFASPKYWAAFNNLPAQFQMLKQTSQLNILWLHDTFCTGDDIIEELVVGGDIDQIFTLSDFHTSYITTCVHGRRRNFEVLKNHIFMTRNGIKCHLDEIDINGKNPNLFIYNASATKGMLPLVNKIWPRIKRAVPAAELRIIGGFYRFREGAAPDAQENTVQQLSQREDLKVLDVHFTGVISQQEIARHFAEASFTIHPGAFPETFGISTLESLAYNTPVLATRFGALEETAVEQACYLLDYAIEPNSLFTDINAEDQAIKFANMAIRAHSNTYLQAQKRQYCNIIKDISDWSGVALQWKQQFFKTLGFYFPADEYRKVAALNKRIHRVYNRRFSNPVEWEHPRAPVQERITIISPFYNAEAYIEKCIRSVASQDYDNYRHYLVDDCSTDRSLEKAEQTIASLPMSIRGKFKLTRNSENAGAVLNQFTMISSILNDNSIVMMLDGDDSLVNDNTIFHMYNSLYAEGCDLTYGSCWSLADNIPLIAQPYPKHVRESKSYRAYRFAWNMPYTHLRTFRRGLFDGIDESVFQHQDGTWLRAGGDTAFFYNLIEAADPNKIQVVQDIVYNYNDLNPLNDYKVNASEQNKTASFVLQSRPN